MSQINQALANAAKGAFLPVRDRDLYQDLIFLDFSLEEPDLESIMGDLVSQDLKIGILIAARKSYTRTRSKCKPLTL